MESMSNIRVTDEKEHDEGTDDEHDKSQDFAQGSNYNEEEKMVSHHEDLHDRDEVSFNNNEELGQNINHHALVQEEAKIISRIARNRRKKYEYRKRKMYAKRPKNKVREEEQPNPQSFSPANTIHPMNPMSYNNFNHPNLPLYPQYFGYNPYYFPRPTYEVYPYNQTQSTISPINNHQLNNAMYMHQPYPQFKCCCQPNPHQNIHQHQASSGIQNNESDKMSMELIKLKSRINYLENENSVLLSKLESLAIQDNESSKECVLYNNPNVEANITETLNTPKSFGIKQKVSKVNDVPLNDLEFKLEKKGAQYAELSRRFQSELKEKEKLKSLIEHLQSKPQSNVKINELEMEVKGLLNKNSKYEENFKKIKEENSALSNHNEKLKDELQSLKQITLQLRNEKEKCEELLYFSEQEKQEVERKSKIERARFSQLKDEFDQTNQKLSLLKKENLNLDNAIGNIKEHLYFIQEENNELKFKKSYLEKENKSLLHILERNNLTYQLPNTQALSTTYSSYKNGKPDYFAAKERSKSKKDKYLTTKNIQPTDEKVSSNTEFKYRRDKKESINRNNSSMIDYPIDTEPKEEIRKEGEETSPKNSNNLKHSRNYKAELKNSFIVEEDGHKQRSKVNDIFASHSSNELNTQPTRKLIKTTNGQNNNVAVSSDSDNNFMLKRNRRDDKEGFMFRVPSNERQKENMEFLNNSEHLNEKLYPQQSKILQVKKELTKQKIVLSNLIGENKMLINKVLIFPDKQISKAQMLKKQQLEEQLQFSSTQINETKRKIRELNKLIE